ncbi:MAG TPA: hypothetical protein VL354_02365, partial [Spirochaetia bacterium]|nr:hypothetical protein [Spirochaetia bacterium]
KARHIATILIGAGVTTWVLMSCNLSGVSIDQRISDFQSDLNTSDRANVYQDFHPTETSQYNALKDPNTSQFNTNFPPGSYTLSVVNESNTTAVIVRVTGPTSGLGYPSPYYLSLSMDTYNGNDYRIVTLSVGGATSGPYQQVYK